MNSWLSSAYGMGDSHHFFDARGLYCGVGVRYPHRREPRYHRGNDGRCPHLLLGVRPALGCHPGRELHPHRCLRQRRGQRHPPQGGLHREEFGFFQDRYPLYSGGHYPRVYLPVADVRDLIAAAKRGGGKRRSDLRGTMGEYVDREGTL